MAGEVPLTTAAKCGGDMIGEGIVQTLIEENPIIQKIPWITFEGVSYIKRREGTLPNPEFRQVNEGWSYSHGEDDFTTWGVAILGGEYFVDNYEQLVVGNERDVEAQQIAKFAKAMSMRFTYEFFYGTHLAGKGFKGLRALVEDGFGHTVNGSGALSLDNLDDAIDAMQGQYSGSAFLLGQREVRAITNLGKPTGGYYPLIDVGTDNFGKRVWHYDGVPLTVVRHSRDGSGNTIDTFGEDADGTSEGKSIYLVNFSTDTVCGLMGAGGSLGVKRFGELEAAPGRMGRVEWYPGVASFDPNGCVRIDGITG